MTGGEGIRVLLAVILVGGTVATNLALARDGAKQLPLARRFCTRPALVHGAEMAKSRGRTSGWLARRGPRLPRRNCATTL